MANYNLETETTVHVKGMTVGGGGNATPYNALYFSVDSDLYVAHKVSTLYISGPICEDTTVQANFNSRFMLSFITNDNDISTRYDTFIDTVVFCDRSDIPQDATVLFDVSSVMFDVTKRLLVTKEVSSILG